MKLKALLEAIDPEVWANGVEQFDLMKDIVNEISKVEYVVDDENGMCRLMPNNYVSGYPELTFTKIPKLEGVRFPKRHYLVYRQDDDKFDESISHFVTDKEAMNKLLELIKEAQA